MSIALSKYFNLEEFVISQTATRLHIDNTPSSDVIANLKLLCINVLEPLRGHYNLPVIISSGYRCTALNKQIGGKSNSQHLTGQAADLLVHGISVVDTVKYIANSGIEFCQLINEYNQWVHVSFVQGKNRKQVLEIK